MRTALRILRPIHDLPPEILTPTPLTPRQPPISSHFLKPSQISELARCCSLNSTGPPGDLYEEAGLDTRVHGGDPRDLDFGRAGNVV